MRARYAGRCPVCCRPISVGQELGRHETYWAHRQCAEAARADGRARTRILEGLEFAGRKPSEWRRRGASPSSSRPRRYTGGRRRGYTRGIRKIA